LKLFWREGSLKNLKAQGEELDGDRKQQCLFSQIFFFPFQEDFKSLRSHLDLYSLHILFWFLLTNENVWRKASSFDKE